MMDPKVRLLRNPAAEIAASIFVQRTLANKIHNKCFLCQSTSINPTEFLSSPRYLEQLKLFKKLVYTPSFRRSFGSKSKQFNFDNYNSCVACVLTVNKIWDMHKRLEAIRREIETAIVTTQEAIRMSSRKGIQEATRTVLVSTRNIKDSRSKIQNLVHLQEENADYILPEFNMDSNAEPVSPEVDASDLEEECNSVADKDQNEDLVEDDQDMNIKLEMVVLENDTSEDVDAHGEHITTRSIRRSNHSNLKAQRVQPKVKSRVKCQPVTKKRLAKPKFWVEVQTESLEDKEEPTIYKCLHANCEMRFDKKPLQLEHFKTVHNGVYQCPDCPSKFPKNSFLTRHRNSVHLKVKRFNCEHCPSKFYDRTNYSAHLRRHTGEKAYRCDKCGTCYHSVGYLNIHKKAYCKLSDVNPEFIQKLNEKRAQMRKRTGRKYNIGRQESVMCEICGKLVKRTNLLEHEKRVHQQIKSHICSQPGCEKGFYRNVDLQRHVTLVHLVEMPNFKVQCDLCGLHFLHKQKLYSHRKRVHQEARFSCDICSRKFWEPGQFEKHMLAHDKDKEKPFTCQDCGKGFKHSRTLTRHQGTGTNTRCPSRKSANGEEDCELESEVEVENQVEMDYVEVSYNNNTS